jgi:hypothetical protein
MSLSVVDLPVPDSPTTTIVSPFMARNETFSRIVRSPKPRCTFSISMTAPGRGPGLRGVRAFGHVAPGCQLALDGGAHAALPVRLVGLRGGALRAGAAVVVGVAPLGGAVALPRVAGAGRGQRARPGRGRRRGRGRARVGEGRVAPGGVGGARVGHARVRAAAAVAGAPTHASTARRICVRK